MTKIKFIIIFLIFNLDIKGQTGDSSLFKKNFIYINPFFFSNDVLELNDYWASLGYDRKVKDKFVVGVNFSAIITSQPSSGVFYGPGFSALKSNGLRANIEGKYFFYKRFYTSINLFVQTTKTFCIETLIDNSNIYPKEYSNFYYVYRQAYSMIPKLGCILKKQTSNFYFDLNIGLGLKYIYSNTKEKVGALSIKREAYSGKIFEYGGAFTYHPLFHLKFGYNI